jgi:hypothetical protein
MMPKIHFLCAVLALTAAPALAETPDYSAGGGKVYASVRGWTVVQSDRYGCSAYPEAMPIVFNTPPAGGWQLIFPYSTSGGEGTFAGSIDVDKSSFTEEYYGDGEWMYSSFPLNMRKAVAAGSRIYANIGPAVADVGLDGATAAMLKVEECWQNLTGWSAATSSRAGTFALSGD